MKRIIKGSFVAIMLSMVLSLGLGFAYADSHEESPAAADPAAEDPSKAYDATFDIIIGGVPDLPPPENTKNSQDAIQSVASLATKVHGLFSPWINYFAFQIGNFLGNDYIFQGSMGKMLHKIWVISRNLVNIAFVFLLLWIALKQIFSFGSESENLRKNLIKFTALLIFVNFSWLATKVVLDAASVFTHIAFAIPSGVSGGATAAGLADGKVDLPQCQVNTNADQPFTGACSPSAIFSPSDAAISKPLYFSDNEGTDNHCDKVKEGYADAYTDGKINTGATDTNKKFQRRTSICMENMNFFEYNQNTSVIYITYGMARIQNLVSANASDSAVQLSIGVIMSLIMQAAYALSLTALFIALIVRMLVLWMFVGFSPFLILVMWFKDNPLEDVGTGDAKFGWGEFSRWAFLPAYIGAIFSVSFIMISAGQAVGDTFVDNVNSGGFTFKLFETQSIFMGIGSLQTFIWLLMSIAVLWMGVFTAISKMSFIGAMGTKVLSATTERVGRLARAPLIAPIIPLGGQKKPQSIMKTVHDFDVLDKTLRSWEAASRDSEGDARRLSEKAKDLTHADAQAVVADPRNTAAINSLISKLGFSSGRDMMERHTDEQILAAIKQNGQIQDGDAKKVLSALTAAHPRSGAVTPRTTTPPVVPPTVPPATPGVTPPAPAPRAPGATSETP